ncbi:hypothetical protein QBC39DRAFT_344048 [Podospora conica]|nr:hypothetical protein QBC39DRAFT_344048 [Schizothecium conicum]
MPLFPFSKELHRAEPPAFRRNKASKQNGKAYTSILAGFLRTNTPQMADEQDTVSVLTRPVDDAGIDEMFVGLMQRRGWNNLPDQAIRVMLSYPTDKKWALIYQDHQAETRSILRRRTEMVEG